MYTGVNCIDCTHFEWCKRSYATAKPRKHLQKGKRNENNQRI